MHIVTPHLFWYLNDKWIKVPEVFFFYQGEKKWKTEMANFKIENVIDGAKQDSES